MILKKEHHALPKAIRPTALRVLLLTGLTLFAASGCTFMEGVTSALVDENAKRQDDAPAYRACDVAYSVCKNSGLESQSCKAQRDLLISEDVYCAKVGVFTGSRAR